MQHFFELFRQWRQGEKTKRTTLEGSLRNWEKLRSGRSPLNTRTFPPSFPSQSQKVHSKREFMGVVFQPPPSNGQSWKIPPMIWGSIDHSWWQCPAPQGQVPALPAGHNSAHVFNIQPRIQVKVYWQANNSVVPPLNRRSSRTGVVQIRH